MGVGASTASIFFPSVSTALGVSMGRLTLFVTIQSLTTMFLLPTAGKLLTKYDIRITVSIPVLGLSASYFAMSRFTEVWQFYIAGFALGVCYSFVLFLAVPILLNNWFQEKLGFVIGLAMSFSGIGGAIFCMIVGIVIQRYGWRLGYVVVAVSIAVIVLPFSLFVIRRSPADKELLPYEAGKAADGANKDAASEIAAPIKGFLLADVSKSTPYRLMLVFSAMMGLIACMQSVMTAYSTTLGFATSVAAMTTSVVSVGILAAKLILGALNDKIGVKRAVRIAYIPALIAVAFLIIARSGRAVPLFTGAALYGVAIAFTSLEPPLIVRELFGTRDYVSIYPRIQRLYSLMSAIAVPIYNTIYDATGSFMPVLLLLIVFMVISLLCFEISYKRMRNYTHG